MLTGALSSILRVSAALPPQDITTPRTGPFVDVSGAQRLLAAATVAASAAANDTVTIAFLQAQDDIGTGAKALGAPVTLTASAAAQPLAPIAEAQIADLDSADGYTFVAVTMQAANGGTALQGGAVLLLGDNRFNPANP